MTALSMDTRSPSGTDIIGVDVGGTFTDVVIQDADGVVHRAKAPTNPKNFGAGVLEGLALLAKQMGVSTEDILDRVETFGLGTTAVTNAMTALVGSTVGLITTRGFEEELNLARGIRPSGPDARVGAPVSLVDRRHVAGVSERIDRDGVVVTPLDETELIEAAEHLVNDAQVGALVVSFMNAYRNDEHEQAAVAVISSAFPDIQVLSATALSPTIGFFQRTTFAVMNAFSASSLDGIEDFQHELAGLGFLSPLRLVNASGGTIGVQAARRAPMGLMHSGPAAGVAAAAAVADTVGISKAIACDMGGTSFDVSIVNAGTPLRRLNAEILGVPTSMSVVDVESIGSGGGSLAWVDRMGMMHVGPESARSDPGPACYGRGGERPTVTDALVVLGYIDPENFLGGSMVLDKGAADRACAHLGEGIGLNAIQVAWGIRQIALADMVGAVRLLFNRRGLDVRDYALVSYGGCGSLFTSEIARALGVSTIIVPEVASVLSAFGAASAPVRHERSRSVAATMPPDTATVRQLIKELRESVHDDLNEDLVPVSERNVHFEADLSFKRQKFQLSIRLAETDSVTTLLDKLTEDFYEEYTSRYGKGSMLLGAPLEMVTLRVIGTGASREALKVEQPADVAGASGAIEPGSQRLVVDEDGGQARKVGVYRDADIVRGALLRGPACIDKVDTTIWLPEGGTASVDANGSLHLHIEAHSERMN